MKGLLIKDFYLIQKHCRSYLLITAVFLAVSFAQDGSLFFLLYPSLMCGMIPVTLLSYDEQSRWTQYSLTLPYTRAQLVSGKYLIGLMVQAAAVLATGIVYTVRMNLSGTFHWSELAILLLILFASVMIMPALSLPLIFKMGVEKGRVVYLAVIGLSCAVLLVAARSLKVDFAAELRLNGVFLLICFAAAAIYAISWILSVSFYKKREVSV